MVGSDVDVGGQELEGFDFRMDGLFEFWIEFVEGGVEMFDGDVLRRVGACGQVTRGKGATTELLKQVEIGGTGVCEIFEGGRGGLEGFGGGGWR